VVRKVNTVPPKEDSKEIKARPHVRVTSGGKGKKNSRTSKRGGGKT